MRPSPLQVCYQRNLLFGLCTSALLSLGFGVWVRSLDGPTSQSASTVTDPNVVVIDHDQVEPYEKPAVVSIGGLNPYAVTHEGFIGFVNLRPKHQTPERIVEPPPAYMQDLDALEVQSTPSFSNVAGDAVGLYVSGEFVGAVDPLPAETVHPPISRQAEVVCKLDPDYPFVARDAGKEGEITVLVYIDSTGELSTFPDWIAGEGIQTLEYTVNGTSKVINYAVKEDPPGWFFAQNFVKVLPNWVFAPRIEEGRPVSSLLRIRYNFCLGGNCLRYELEQLES